MQSWLITMHRIENRLKKDEEGEINSCRFSFARSCHCRHKKNRNWKRFQWVLLIECYTLVDNDDDDDEEKNLLYQHIL